MMSSIIAQLLRGWASCKIRYTVWKFQDFSVTHILREINFENQSTYVKTDTLSHFRG